MTSSINIIRIITGSNKNNRPQNSTIRTFANKPSLYKKNDSNKATKVKKKERKKIYIALTPFSKNRKKKKTPRQNGNKKKGRREKEGARKDKRSSKRCTERRVDAQRAPPLPVELDLSTFGVDTTLFWLSRSICCRVLHLIANGRAIATNFLVK